MSSAERRLEELLSTQPLGVLATESEHEPYTSLLAFVADGLFTIYVATPRSSRKWDKVAANSNVSFLVDDRTNAAADFADAAAATATGMAAECADTDEEHVRALILERHPHLRDFLRAPSTSLIRVRVARWYLVERFQNVTMLEPTE